MDHDHSKPLSPEEDALVAAEALAEGDLPHAIYHLAGAIYADPERQDWRALLAEAFRRSPDPVALVPLRSKGLWPGEALILALALDWVGRKAESLSVLLQVASQNNVRMLPVLAAAAEGPEVLASGAARWTHFLSAWIGRLPGLVVGDDQKPVVEFLLPLAEIAHFTWPQDESLSALFLSLLRKAGRFGEALRLGPRLYAATPGWPVAVMMAQLHMARGVPAEAMTWYEKALEYRPEEISVRNDLGDLWFEQGDWEQAARWYGEVLQRQPQESWAEPSFLFCRLVTGEAGCRSRLEELADGGNERARRLAEKATPWLSWLPLLSPGEEALLAVPPDEEVGKAVWILASQPYSLQSWSEAAFRLATALKPAAEQLLGAVSQVPEAPEGLEPWIWRRRYQMAATLILGHLPEGPAILGTWLEEADGARLEMSAVVLAQLAMEGRQEPEQVTGGIRRRLPRNAPPALLESLLRLASSTEERKTLRKLLDGSGVSDTE